MAIAAFGPRFLAVINANPPLANATSWAASTVYARGATVTFGTPLSLYVAPPAGVPSRTTFTVGDWILIAQGTQGGQGTQGIQGIQGTAAPLFVGTVTCDGINHAFTITHNLNSTSLVGQIHDPNDSNAVVPGVDITFPSTTTATIDTGNVLPSGTVLTVVIH